MTGPEPLSLVQPFDDKATRALRRRRTGSGNFNRNSMKTSLASVGRQTPATVSKAIRRLRNRTRISAIG
jgi:hypothetical protein